MAQKTKRHPLCCTQRGYTLVETSIVLMILSLVLLGLTVAYKFYVRDVITSRQISARVQTESSISRFLFMNGRLPCPADASLARNDIQYGRENCTFPVLKIDGSGPVPLTGGCNQPAGGLCTTDSAGSNVIRGMVPFATLNLEESKAYDAYGSRLIYAVSRPQTDVTTYVQEGGTISIRDIASVGTGAEVSLVTPPDKADFVVVSVGPNRVGAFSKGDAGVLTADGRRHLTSVSNPCTRTTTGGAGEFSNCDPTSSVFYAGGTGLNFQAYDQGNTEPWDTSAFLDDTVVYFLFNGVQPWRLNTPTGNDVIMRSSDGLMGVNNETPEEKLDLQLFTTAPGESAIRSTNAVIAAQNAVCDANGDCFDPKDLTGDPDLGTGGMKCPAGKYIVGITGNGTNISPICEAVALTFCQPPKRLKGFDISGNPICVALGTLTCPAKVVEVCNDTPQNRIAHYINRRLSYGDPNHYSARAWYNSNLTGVYPRQTLAGGNEGAITSAWTRTVILNDSSNLPCYNGNNPAVVTLHSKGLISPEHAIWNNWAVGGTATPMCKYGFNGQERREFYKCTEGTWVRHPDSDSGVCTTGCIMKDYPKQVIQCKNLNWRYVDKPAQVRITNRIGDSDDRNGRDTRSRWSGEFTIPAGSSCSGVAPSMNPADANVCRCTGDPINLSQDVGCGEGNRIDPEKIPADAIIPGKDNMFIQRVNFTCHMGQTYGTWSEWAPKAGNVCKCDAGATRYVAYACYAGTTAGVGASTPLWRQNRTCGTPPSWQNPGAPQGVCTCVPNLNQAIGAPERIACDSNYLAAGWTARANTYGYVLVQKRQDTTCTKTLAGAGIPPDQHPFYPGLMVPETQPVRYEVEAVNCYPLNSTWKTSSAISSTGPETGTALGAKCFGPADRVQCLGLPGMAPSDCPQVDANRPCYAPADGSNFYKYDSCFCGG